MNPPATPASAPVRVLVDLAALERVDQRSADVHRGGRTWHAVPPPAPGALHAPHVGATQRSHFDRAALPTVGRLAREGALVLCTYVEFDAPGSRAQWAGTWRELLGDVPVTTVPPALSRRQLGEDVFRDGAQAGALARLCARLKISDPPAGEDADGVHGLESLERFRRLAARVQGDHLADLFHLWSGELAGCRYCLSPDDALEDFVRLRVEPWLDAPLLCEPIRPHDLLCRLGVETRDARPSDPHRIVSIRRPDDIHRDDIHRGDAAARPTGRTDGED